MASYTYDDIVNKLITRLKSQFNISAELSDKTSLVELNLDSLDIMSFIFYIEEEFNIAIPDEELEKENFIIIGETANYILNGLSK